jgi:hypothetical protein
LTRLKPSSSYYYSSRSIHEDLQWPCSYFGAYPHLPRYRRAIDIVNKN